MRTFFAEIMEMALRYNPIEVCDSVLLRGQKRDVIGFADGPCGNGLIHLIQPGNILFVAFVQHRIEA